MSHLIANRALPESARHFDTLPDTAHVRQPTVQALYGISSATVWRWVSAGHIPRPHRHGARVTTWNVGELRAALRAKA